LDRFCRPSPWESEGFALADRFDDTSGRYEGLAVPGGDSVFGTITDATLLVAPKVALEQKPVVEPEDAPDVGGGKGDEPALSGESGKGDEPAPKHRTFLGTYKVSPERYGRDLSRLSQEVLQHLASVDGVDLEVTVEIRATTESGFPDDKARIIIENAHALKFDQSTFE